MKLEEVISNEKIKYDEDMKRYTTMKVGGKADIMVFPETEEEIIKVIDYAKKENIPVHIIGNGSNILVSDLGIEGIVINERKMSKIELKENGEIYVSTGVGMPRIATFAKENSLTGFEFACGIPGLIGGRNKNECRCIWLRN